MGVKQPQDHLKEVFFLKFY